MDQQTTFSDDIQKNLRAVLADMVERQAPITGDLFVIGCSTSEVQGRRIGKCGSPDIATALYPIFAEFAETHGLRLAFQCCEHLNRALVVRKKTAVEERLPYVQVIPQPTAGGSMASCAFQTMAEAVLVESLNQSAGYGIDIGLTMIGMHMRPVVVPMRLPHKTIGEAVVNCAFSRPKLIGGERAVYTVE